MNEQVFTTITSASSARGESSAPARARKPIITSLSTRFFGHPRLTKPTFCGRTSWPKSVDAGSVVFSAGSEIVRFFEGMLSGYFNILRRESRWNARRTITGDMHLSIIWPVGTTKIQQAVDENSMLHANLGVTEEQSKSRILEGKCLGNRP